MLIYKFVAIIYVLTIERLILEIKINTKTDTRN